MRASWAGHRAVSYVTHIVYIVHIYIYIYIIVIYTYTLNLHSQSFKVINNRRASICTLRR